MLAPVHHILPLTTIVRERKLPVPGRVITRLDQKVNPTDVIAEAPWGTEHLLLDVGRLLNVSAARAERLIRCKVGDRLVAGAEIATGGGIIPRVVRAPRDGRVVAVGGGEVLLEVGESNLQLRAGMPGIVTQIIPERGAVIQTTGALIQGVWGNGRVEMGTLVNLMESAADVLTAARLDISLRGAMVIAGICKDAEALRVAAELPVRGLILSSISPTLLSLAREMRFPIVVTDGFGEIPMNSAAYRLLTTNVKREATLHAEAYDRYSGVRPEIIIPLPVTQEPPAPREVDVFAPGQQVRLRRSPAAGMIGTLVNLKAGLTVLPSGLRAPAAEVKLENGETILAPLVNLEVVG
ncbi:MAG: hypothetical protein ACP5QU_04635 [Anaerolineae bacterium]